MYFRKGSLFNIFSLREGGLVERGAHSIFLALGRGA